MPQASKEHGRCFGHRPHPLLLTVVDAARARSLGKTVVSSRLSWDDAAVTLQSPSETVHMAFHPPSRTLPIRQE